MSLPQATKDKLKTTYGFDVDKLIEAVTATEEKDFAVPDDVTVIKTADLTTRDTNNKEAGKTEGKKEGEQHGKELAAKQFKKKFALEDSVPADIDKVVEAVNTKLNKGDAGLQEQITLLQKDKERMATELDQATVKAKQAIFDAELITHFPVDRDTFLTDKEWLNRVKENLSFEEHEGKQVVKRNGEIMRDKTTQNPVPQKDAIISLFTENKWRKGEAGPGGRGAGDRVIPTGGSAIKTGTAFQEKWLAENPGGNVISDEYTGALNKHAKDVPDFDFYK